MTSESPMWKTTPTQILQRELKHLSTFRKRNQPRFRKYWRKKAEKTTQKLYQTEQGGILDQRW